MSVAEKGKKILLKKPGYYDLSNGQKKNVFKAFGKNGKMIQSRAFDLIHTTKKINFSDEKDVSEKIRSIKLVEIKSTGRDLDSKFSKYWFGLTMRELIMGQLLQDQYKFVFVNVKTKKILEQNFSQVLSKISHVDLLMHLTFK
jgi:hypothetical protein